MTDNLGLGYVWGFLVSLVSVVIAAAESGTRLAGLLAWGAPATFLGGLVLMVHRDSRRLGAGLALGALTMAAIVLVFLIWLVSQVGS